MEITLATHSHVPGIVEVWKEFMDFLKNIDSFFSRSEDGHVIFAEFVKDSIQSDESQVLVASDKGRVVAYSIAHVNRPSPMMQRETYGYISHMAVNSNYRRSGIGERMLARIRGWCDSHGIDRIELRVVAKNQVGYSFWGKQGFEDYMHVLYLNKSSKGGRE